MAPTPPSSALAGRQQGGSAQSCDLRPTYKAAGGGAPTTVPAGRWHLSGGHGSDTRTASRCLSLASALFSTGHGWGPGCMGGVQGAAPKSTPGRPQGGSSEQGGGKVGKARRQAGCEGRAGHGAAGLDAREGHPTGTGWERGMGRRSGMTAMHRVLGWGSPWRRVGAAAPTTQHSSSGVPGNHNPPRSTSRTRPRKALSAATQSRNPRGKFGQIQNDSRETSYVTHSQSDPKGTGSPGSRRGNQVQGGQQPQGCQETPAHGGRNGGRANVSKGNHAPHHGQTAGAQQSTRAGEGNTGSPWQAAEEAAFAPGVSWKCQPGPAGSRPTA